MRARSFVLRPQNPQQFHNPHKQPTQPQTTTRYQQHNSSSFQPTQYDKQRLRYKGQESLDRRVPHSLFFRHFSSNVVGDGVPSLWPTASLDGICIIYDIISAFASCAAPTPFIAVEWTIQINFNNVWQSEQGKSI